MMGGGSRPFSLLECTQKTIRLGAQRLSPRGRTYPGPHHVASVRAGVPPPLGPQSGAFFSTPAPHATFCKHGLVRRAIARQKFLQNSRANLRMRPCTRRNHYRSFVRILMRLAASHEATDDLAV